MKSLQIIVALIMVSTMIIAEPFRENEEPRSRPTAYQPRANEESSEESSHPKTKRASSSSSSSRPIAESTKVPGRESSSTEKPMRPAPKSTQSTKASQKSKGSRKVALGAASRISEKRDGSDDSGSGSDGNSGGDSGSDSSGPSSTPNASLATTPSAADSDKLSDSTTALPDATTPVDATATPATDKPADLAIMESIGSELINKKNPAVDNNSAGSDQNNSNQSEKAPDIQEIITASLLTRIQKDKIKLVSNLPVDGLDYLLP